MEFASRMRVALHVLRGCGLHSFGTGRAAPERCALSILRHIHSPSRCVDSYLCSRARMAGGPEAHGAGLV